MDAALSFFTLSLLEIVLGIDNLIFIALVCQDLPASQRKKARTIGLTIALAMRVVMLMGATWIMTLTKPIVTIDEFALSFKDLLLLGGGLFLIAKSTSEIHDDIGGEKELKEVIGRKSFRGAITQIVLIDFVFSFDSIITAVGISDQLHIMIAAITVAMVVMLLCSEYISKFLNDFPTFKILALSFIMMIGMLLVAEALHFHVPRAYLYFAFGFSIFIEVINNLKRRKLKKKRSR